MIQCWQLVSSNTCSGDDVIIPTGRLNDLVITSFIQIASVVVEGEATMMVNSGRDIIDR
ncbi:MAG: hypothetical protein AAF806_29240 [Bacteroidota bacterium]